MPEEATPAPVEEQDKPTTESAPEEVGTSTTPDEKPEYFSEHFDPATLADEFRPAYNQMRGDYSRKTAELAEQRKELEQEQALLSALRSDDPAVQSQALEFLGYEIPKAEEKEEDYTDPLDEMRAEIAELRTARQTDEQQRQQYEQEQQELDGLESQFATLEKSTGREFTDAQVDVIAGLAFSRRDDKGQPDVAGAYEKIYSELFAEERTRWTSSKQAPKAPAGQSGTQQVDYSDSENRVKRMAEIMAQGE